MKSNRNYLVACIVVLVIGIGCTQKPQTMIIETENTMAQQFYTLNHQNNYWFSSKRQIEKANEWLDELELAHRYGIAAEKEQIENIRASLLNKNEISISVRDEDDQNLTGMVLNFIKELQEGQVHFDYDEVSVSRDSVYANLLLQTKPSKPVQQLASELDCKNPDYQLLKRFLNDSITIDDTIKYKSVVKAMNYLRYLSVNAHSEYIVVNIPETVARYYRDSSLTIEMRTVVGRKKSPTPTIASHINIIVTYPHWNVPHSIAVKEILPKVQKDEIYLEQNNLTVVDAKGIEVEDVDWTEYTARTFPYFFRQSTGAKNALGVLKFNFENPFSIYLHSTSLQSAFLKENRFLSHGCIRLEKPIELATSLLRGKLDIAELKTGKKDTESELIELTPKVPVFIIYSPVSIHGDTIAFLPDVYGLIQ